MTIRNGFHKTILSLQSLDPTFSLVQGVVVAEYWAEVAAALTCVVALTGALQPAAEVVAAAAT